MRPSVFTSVWRTVDQHTEAFEQAIQLNLNTRVDEFLPDPASPQFSEVLCEILRVQMEYMWNSGQGKNLEYYFEKFPMLMEKSEFLQRISFEHYRQRLEHGDSPSPEEYSDLYGVNSEDWPVQQSEPKEEPTTQIISPEQLVHAKPVASDLIDEMGQDNRVPMKQLSYAADSFPKPGTLFLGFRLLLTLGQGAFGQVYLARQPSLANRLVVLKVSIESLGESQHLAKLQHTNIVPVFSVHQASSHHVLCMPYLGLTTLADVLSDINQNLEIPSHGESMVRTIRNKCASTIANGVAKEDSRALFPEDSHSIQELRKLSEKSYIEAVLWMGAKLADALTHSHQRGIIHRDLKPANILLADDGQPMLLDFNLSVDQGIRGSFQGAKIGGTLPYMAPEQLTAYSKNITQVDARSDLYSLGCILYELLTGRIATTLQYENTEISLKLLIESRQNPIPPASTFNSALTPAIDSILNKLLTSDMEKRYQSSDDLQTDIQSHLLNRPLIFAPNTSGKERFSKFLRRHPRLMSIGSIGVVTASLLIIVSLFGYRAWDQNQLQSNKMELADFLAKKQNIETLVGIQTLEWNLLSVAVKSGDELLAKYVPEVGDFPTLYRLDSDEKKLLKRETGELALRQAMAHRMKGQNSTDLTIRREHFQTGLRLCETAERCLDETGKPLLLQVVAEELRALISDKQVPTRPKVGPADLSPHESLLAATEHFTAHRFREAIPYLQKTLDTDPGRKSAWMLLGECHFMLANYAKSESVFDTAIGIDPELSWAYYYRALNRMELGNYRFSLNDFDKFVSKSPNEPVGFLYRSKCLTQLRKFDEALNDLKKAESHNQFMSLIHILRSRIYIARNDTKAAQAEIATMLQLKPVTAFDWTNRATALIAKDHAGALESLENALKLERYYLPALQNKANLLSESFNKPEAAIQSLDVALQNYPDFLPSRAGRAVLLARLNRRNEAHLDAERCLRQLNDPSVSYQIAGVYAQTSRTHPQDKVEAFRLLRFALSNGFGHEDLATDPDLKPIRTDAEFEGLKQLFVKPG